MRPGDPTCVPRFRNWRLHILIWCSGRKQPFFLIGLRIKMGDCHGPCPRNDIRDSFCNGIKATFCNDIRASFCNGIQYIFCNDFVSFLKLLSRGRSWVILNCHSEASQKLWESPARSFRQKNECSTVVCRTICLIFIKSWTNFRDRICIWTHCEAVFWR